MAREGLSKEEVKKILFEETRISLDHIPRTSWERILPMRLPLQHIVERMGKLPVVHRWEDIQVAVAGGAGKHSAFIPTFGSTKSITKAIALKDGRPMRSVKEFRWTGEPVQGGR